ncbi:MAG: cyclase family protein [Chloroflexi bacterium]|nr:cyclase family protein [Chloroflexota bacterium]
MPTFRLLSYSLNERAPVWPGNPPSAKTEVVQAIARGDAANTTLLHLFSHSGTHIDSPRHFNPAGVSGWQVPIERYIFFHPRIIPVPKPNGGLITLAELEPHRVQLADADLALLLTGWSQYRTSDPARYSQQGPLLHPAAARWLMETFPKLKAVAIDAVSIGAPGYPKESVETHQVLTGVGRTDGRYLLIVEDLRIDPDLHKASRIYALPLLIEGSDGSPCTIVAEFPD